MEPRGFSSPSGSSPVASASPRHAREPEYDFVARRALLARFEALGASKVAAVANAPRFRAIDDEQRCPIPNALASSASHTCRSFVAESKENMVASDLRVLTHLLACRRARWSGTQWQSIGSSTVYLDGLVVKSGDAGTVTFRERQNKLLIKWALIFELLVLVFTIAVPSFADVFPAVNDFIDAHLPNSTEIFSFFVVIVLVVVAMLGLGASAERLQRKADALVDGKRSDLPLALSLLLESDTMQCMISYSWSNDLKDLARSLANVLHRCWIDTKFLVAGDEIPEETVSVAAHCRCLIILLSDHYLGSWNCLAELVSAVLFRVPTHHRTVVLVRPEEFPDAARRQAIIEAVLACGFDVVESAPDLVAFLDEQVLRAPTPVEEEPLVAWWRAHGRPATDFGSVQNLRSSRQTTDGEVFSLRGERSWSSNNDVLSGVFMLRGDLQWTGKIQRVTTQQRWFLAVALGNAALVAHPFVSSVITGEHHMSNPIFWSFTAILLATSFVAISSTFGLDARDLHDPTLFTLNLAGLYQAPPRNTLPIPVPKWCHDPDDGPTIAMRPSSPRRSLATSRSALDLRTTAANEGPEGSSPRTPSETGAAAAGTAAGAVAGTAAAVATVAPPLTRALSTAAALANSRLSIRFLLGANPTAFMERASANVRHFLEYFASGTHCIEERVLDGREVATSGSSLSVFMLDSPEATRGWIALMRRNAAAWPTTHTVLVATEAVLGDSELCKPPTNLRDFLCIVTGTKHGVADGSPYPSLAKALMDCLARKVSAVVVSGNLDFVGAGESCSRTTKTRAGAAGESVVNPLQGVAPLSIGSAEAAEP